MIWGTDLFAVCKCQVELWIYTKTGIPRKSCKICESLHKRRLTYVMIMLCLIVVLMMIVAPKEIFEVRNYSLFITVTIASCRSAAINGFASFPEKP